LLISVFSTFNEDVLFFLNTSTIVFFDAKLDFFPLEGSTTIIIILSATLKGLASDFLTAFYINFLKIGNAAFDPVSNLPNGLGLSIPT